MPGGTDLLVEVTIALRKYAAYFFASLLIYYTFKEIFHVVPLCAPAPEQAALWQC